MIGTIFQFVIIVFVMLLLFAGGFALGFVKGIKKKQNVLTDLIGNVKRK